MMTVEKARAFAQACHAGQTRKGVAAEPYFSHVAEVAGLVARFGGSPDAEAAAWLHDVVEDCGVPLGAITAAFGEAVGALVGEVSDDKSLPKAERKRLQIVHAAERSADAAIVKICDKIANVGSLIHSPASDWETERQIAYVNWAEAVVMALPSGADPARPLFAATAARAREVILARADGQGLDRASGALGA